MTQFLLDKEDSATIGFVVASAFANAIDRSEIQAWADHVLVTADKYPLYIVDLSTFDGPLANIYEIIRFAPHSGLNDKEHDALIGIAFLRGRQQFEPVPTKDQALSALTEHPHVLARFRETFPFIAVPDQQSASAAPNGGPAEPSGDSELTGGPPSAS
jgi:hypothetical protein